MEAHQRPKGFRAHQEAAEKAAAARVAAAAARKGKGGFGGKGPTRAPIASGGLFGSSGFSTAPFAAASTSPAPVPCGWIQVEKAATVSQRKSNIGWI